MYIVNVGITETILRCVLTRCRLANYIMSSHHADIAIRRVTRCRW